MKAGPRPNPELPDPMNASSHSPCLPAPTLILLAAFGALLFSSCASSTNRAPSPGMAIFDATPDADRRDRIDGIHIESVNGQAASGSELELAPGRNKVRVGFDWPQGGEQQVDLPFQAKANKTYLVYYNVYPPYVNRLQEGGLLDDATRDLAMAGASAGEGAIIFVPPLALLGSAAIARRVGNEIAEDSKAAHYVDVMVVAQKDRQGVACTRRVYPDGRVERR